MEKKKLTPVLVIFLAVFVLLYVVIYIIPTVTGALRTSYTVEYGRLQTYDAQNGYFVRTEQVYAACEDGEENRYIEEGKLVRAGTRILDIVAEVPKGDEADAGEESEHGSREAAAILELLGGEILSDVSYKSQTEGVVCYSVDGYEAKLTPETMLDQPRSFYEKLSQDEVKEMPQQGLRDGDPVFKIADRSSWYIVCFIPEEHADRYEEGKEIKIRIDDRKTIDAEVQTLQKDKKSGDVMMVCETDYFYDRFASTRVAQVRTITSDASGLIIENGSIAQENGVDGVYVLQKDGSYRFTEIHVIATDGEHSVISQTSFRDADGKVHDTVKNYDEILKRG